MKTMKNFAAQQMTKQQMNEVKGGRPGAYLSFFCTFNLKGGGTVTGVVPAPDGASAVIMGGLAIETSLGKGMVIGQTCR